MKVIYDEQENRTHDIDPKGILLLEALQLDSDFKGEIKLELFEDVLIMINDINLLISGTIQEVEHNHQGLCYFGADNIRKQFYQAIKKREIDKIQDCKAIEAFFERHIDRVNWWN